MKKVESVIRGAFQASYSHLFDTTIYLNGGIRWEKKL
jgi:hypothetical protein